MVCTDVLQSTLPQDEPPVVMAGEQGSLRAVLLGACHGVLRSCGQGGGAQEGQTS